MAPHNPSPEYSAALKAEHNPAAAEHLTAYEPDFDRLTSLPLPDSESATWSETIFTKLGQLAQSLPVLPRPQENKEPSWGYKPRKKAIIALYDELKRDIEEVETPEVGVKQRVLLTDNGTLYELRRKKQNTGDDYIIRRHTDYVTAGMNNCVNTNDDVTFEPITKTYILRRVERARGATYTFDYGSGLGKPSPEEILELEKNIRESREAEHPATH